MNIQRKKIVNDMLANKSRTLLVVLAIAVGITAFGSVFTTRKILIESMDTQYVAAYPSSVSVSIKSFDQDLVDWVKKQDDVANAQGERLETVKVSDKNKKFNLEVHGFKNFDSAFSINKIELESGRYPKNSREIVLERRSLSLTGRGINEYLTVETPDGGAKEVLITGTVHDIKSFPATMFPVLTGYMLVDGMDRLGFDPKFNKLNLRLSDQYTELQQVEQFSDGFRDFLEARGIDVKSISSQKPLDHWAKEISEAFILILTIIGVFSLVLSGFLVVNTITAVIAQQKRQIGVIKAIGATNKQVIIMYVTMIVLYGLLGIAVALPSSYALGWLFTKIVADFLNVDLTNFYLPRDVIVVELILGIFVPLVAGLIPVMVGTKITVREALSENPSKISRSKRGLISKIFITVSNLPRTISFPFRNVLRQRFRLLMTLGTLVVAGALFISVINMKYTIDKDGENYLKMFNFDIQFMLGDYYNKDEVVKKALATGLTRSAEPRLYATAQKVNADNSLSNEFTLSGLKYDSPFVSPTMLQGRWLDANDKNSLVVSSPLKNDIKGLGVGEEIELKIDNKNSRWKIVGIVSMAGQDKIAFTDIENLGIVIGKTDQASQLLVDIDDLTGLSMQEAAESVEDELQRAGFKVGGYLTIDTIIASNENQNNFLIYFLLSMSVMVAIVGALSLAGTISLNVLERTREIGVMRSIGATNTKLFVQVVSEGLIIGILSWLIALPISFPASWLFAYGLGMSFAKRPMEPVYSIAGIGVWLHIICAISILASFFPAKNATNLTIRDTLAYE